MDEWDADNFESKISFEPSANKWEGEDEDDDVKDNWEDEEEQPEEDEEEKKDVEKQEPPKSQGKKPKKALADKIEEREQRMKDEAQKRLKSTEPQKPMTPEEMQAEKLRQEQLQKESDLRVAMETFGVSESNIENGIDAMNPNSKEEFDEFREALIKKIQPFSKSSHYPVFIEELTRSLCVNISSQDLKKLKTTLETLFQEKLKIEKGDKPKKVKGKGKIKLKVEGENAIVNEYAGYDYDDFDDFM